MKVLFAVNNENISNLIVKKYQKDYKEIISFKNVYYFNAILKEIQKDKTYDRIVISEDLEQFANSNYQQMDKFIFDRLDSISDEASNAHGEDIPIILLCSERRIKGDETLVKLFGIGIYNAVIGKDRDINEVCNLINKPRSKKEAKEYYKIDSEDVNYQAENENDVSEIEIQNILAHYKRLGKNEEKYVESFDNIALQYNDVQLKIICKFLPLNVRAVLEEKSPKYQQLMAFNKSVSEAMKNREKQQPGTSEKLLVTPNSKNTLSKPVVIPTTVKSGEVKRLTKTEQPSVMQIEEDMEDIFDTIPSKEVTETKEAELEKVLNGEQAVMKKGRGRPKKVLTEEERLSLEQKQNQPKRGRGRPKKIQEEVAQELPGFEEDDDLNELPGFDEEQEDTNKLPGFEEEDNSNELPGFNEEDSTANELPGFEDFDEFVKSNTAPKSTQYNYEGENKPYTVPSRDDAKQEDEFELPGFEEESKDYVPNDYSNMPEQNMVLSNNEENYAKSDLRGLLTRDKKIVSFVGTSKNGTSFILNNLAELLSSQGINVAILDTTKNRNSYYIYTKNEENLRKVAFESIKNLSLGKAQGISVNSNLTVYTSLPSESEGINKVGAVLETLINNHSLILVDCDFDTPLEYFANSQEIYLVQSMDVLTIQPLTAFLRELKAKKILEESKIRIIINKYMKLRNVTEKAIIGGMAFYNDPAMEFMTELFNKNTVRYFTIPFEEDIYIKYLEGLINCDISLKGYPKAFMQTLKQLGNSVFPLISGKSSYTPPQVGYSFNPNVNNTLNKMKRNY